MDLAKKILFASIMITTIFEISFGIVHDVGDSDGWTVMRVDYEKWALNKTFHVGDTIVFNYNMKFHDVMRVTLEEFKSCIITSEKASYHSGSDSITLKKSGHHYYMCSIPGHCEAGQKVDILVAGGSDISRATQSPSATPSTTTTPMIKTPSTTPLIKAPSPAPLIKVHNQSNAALTLTYSLFLLGLKTVIIILVY